VWGVGIKLRVLSLEVESEKNASIENRKESVRTDSETTTEQKKAGKIVIS
jgi:hypothetical protein